MAPVNKSGVFFPFSVFVAFVFFSLFLPLPTILAAKLSFASKAYRVSLRSRGTSIGENLRIFAR